MGPKQEYNRRLLCEALEPRAMLSGRAFFGGIPTKRLDPFNVAAGVMGPESPKATVTASNPSARVNVGISPQAQAAATAFNPFPGVNVGVGPQAQAAATANIFLAGIANSVGPLNRPTIGPPNPFAPAPGLASPLQIGPASPVTNEVVSTANTLSPLVNAVSSLTNTLNAIPSNSTSSGFGNTFNIASSTLNALTFTLNALVNAPLVSDINSFLGNATVIVQVNPGISKNATPFVAGNLGNFPGATPFAQINSGFSETVGVVVNTVLAAETAVNNAVAQTTGPIAPLIGQVLATSQLLVNNLTLAPLYQ
jgi:hypothetical protein